VLVVIFSILRIILSLHLVSMDLLFILFLIFSLLLSDLLFLLFFLFSLSVGVLFRRVLGRSVFLLFLSVCTEGRIFVVVYLLVVILVISKICIIGVAISLHVFTVNLRLLLLLKLYANRLTIEPVKDLKRIR